MLKRTNLRSQLYRTNRTDKGECVGNVARSRGRLPERYKFIQQRDEDGKIDLLAVRSEDQVAEFCTKRSANQFISQPMLQLRANDSIMKELSRGDWIQRLVNANKCPGKHLFVDTMNRPGQHH
jgi:hypothetical protein